MMALQQWNQYIQGNTFLTDRDQKGTQLLDPEDLQGYLAYLAYQVMEKLGLLAHLDHLDHQAPLQYMDQVSFSLCVWVYIHVPSTTQDQFFHTWQVVPPAHPLCIPESGCSLLSSCPPPISPRGELELRAQKGQFLCRQFLLTSAMGVLLNEGSCCGWEEICIEEIGYLDSFAKSIKLGSWLNLGQNTLLVGSEIKSSWWPQGFFFQGSVLSPDLSNISYLG